MPETYKETKDGLIYLKSVEGGYIVVNGDETASFRFLDEAEKHYQSLLDWQIGQLERNWLTLFRSSYFFKLWVSSNTASHRWPMAFALVLFQAMIEDQSQ